MKFNVHFRIKGPAGEKLMPNSTNPVSASDMPSVLKLLADNIPFRTSDLRIEITGVHVERLKEDER